ncbi:hypothetical protein MNBD_GAMMA18-220 [hydrothermal vent metagenome]|uniref:Uncharacterized protein n=1 Tax=hydrothermal vent metagenome TaxID=652676 RepID=A0A3B0ZCN5_9ZZZZ
MRRYPFSPLQHIPSPEKPAIRYSGLYHSASRKNLKRRGQVLPFALFGGKRGRYPISQYHFSLLGNIPFFEGVETAFFRNPRLGPLGYEPLLKLLRQQSGHSPTMAGKQAQQDPDTTGCEFADQVLLPAIRQAQVFIDQEVVFESPQA